MIVRESGKPIGERRAGHVPRVLLRARFSAAWCALGCTLRGQCVRGHGLKALCRLAWPRMDLLVVLWDILHDP